MTPAKWINFAVTANDFEGKNDDPLVNHREHNRDFSFATQMIANEKFSFDFNYSHDDVFSKTDLCYVFMATANYRGYRHGRGIDRNILQRRTIRAEYCRHWRLLRRLISAMGRYDAPVNFFLSGRSVGLRRSISRIMVDARMTDNERRLPNF